MGHTETLVANRVDVLIIMRGGIFVMISKFIKIMEKHKREFLAILTLGLSLKINIILNLEFDFSITFKILLLTTIGYQVVKKVTKNNNIK